MNRKLLNGLLVLAVAAGGVGTFTSCKDESFNNDLKVGQIDLQGQIDAIRSIEDAAFKNSLEEWLNGWTDDLSSEFGSYENMVACADAMYKVYEDIVNNNITGTTADYVSNLYDWMFNNKIQASDWYKLIYQLQEELGNLTERATSVEVNQVYNPIFGSITTPLGITSTVLGTYKYEAVSSFNFPTEAYLDHISTFSPYQPTANDQVFAAIRNLTSGVMLDGVAFTDAGDFGNMGGAVLTINPSSNDFTSDAYTVELVNSLGDVVLSSEDESLSLEAYDAEDPLMFGYTRAEGQGLYKLNANATMDNYEDLAFDLDKTGLKDAAKQFLADKDLSSMAHLAEMVFNSVNNQLPAYAVKVSWEENIYDEETGEVTGTMMNSVSSPLNMAATVMHPLSYNTDIAHFIPSDKKLPVIHNDLTYYLDRLENKIHLDFSNIEGVESVDLLTTFDGNGTIHAEVMDSTGKSTGQYIDLTYTADGVRNPDPQTLDQFIHDLLGTIEDDINDSVITSVNNAIANINKQLADLQDQLGEVNDYLNRLKNSNKLKYAQKLVDLYNDVAVKANHFLENPNHYLQVAMAYSLGNGAHHVSNDMYMPSTVSYANGETLDLITTSYTGDVLIPSYKKYVAITGVVENGSVTTAGLETLNSDAGLNVVYSGTEGVCPVNLKSLVGKTVRLTYISVDYRGECSMENYFLRVQ